MKSQNCCSWPQGNGSVLVKSGLGNPKVTGSNLAIDISISKMEPEAIRIASIKEFRPTKYAP